MDVGVLGQRLMWDAVAFAGVGRSGAAGSRMGTTTHCSAEPLDEAERSASGGSYALCQEQRLLNFFVSPVACL